MQAHPLDRIGLASGNDKMFRFKYGFGAFVDLASLGTLWQLFGILRANALELGRTIQHLEGT